MVVGSIEKLLPLQGYPIARGELGKLGEKRFLSCRNEGGGYYDSFEVGHLRLGRKIILVG